MDDKQQLKFKAKIYYTQLIIIISGFNCQLNITKLGVLVGVFALEAAGRPLPLGTSCFIGSLNNK